MAAQGYQESTLDQNVKSPVGAVGVMQVMPPTGKELNVGNISEVEPNIHAGVKYMRFMMDQYFKDEPMDDLNKALRLRSISASPCSRSLFAGSLATFRTWVAPSRSTSSATAVEPR